MQTRLCFGGRVWLYSLKCVSSESSILDCVVEIAAMMQIFWADGACDKSHLAVGEDEGKETEPF